MIPDKLITDLQRLIDAAINLPHEDAVTMLNEIINDAQDALDNLTDEAQEEE